MTGITEPVKQTTDILAGTAVGAAWLNMLPDLLSIIALALSIVWFMIRIWESETVKDWRNKE